MVGSCDVKPPIRLEGLAWSHGHFAQYEPELFGAHLPDSCPRSCCSSSSREDRADGREATGGHIPGIREHLPGAHGVQEASNPGEEDRSRSSPPRSETRRRRRRCPRREPAVCPPPAAGENDGGGLAGIERRARRTRCAKERGHRTTLDKKKVLAYYAHHVISLLRAPRLARRALRARSSRKEKKCRSGCARNRTRKPLP